MEWTFSFSKVPPDPVALVQLCSRDHIALIHVSQVKSIPPTLARILNDPNTPKTGATSETTGLNFKRTTQMLVLVCSSFLDQLRF